jgi:hypothetical protein
MIGMYGNTTIRAHWIFTADTGVVYIYGMKTFYAYWLGRIIWANHCA